ncbi:MAG: S46 family peptidase, partial [Planctomycetaceae bacterium]|nr:S46 family peptidase [Planctomycetaceae bacterium]
AAAPAAAAPRFENPGGMWMPEQMGQHAEQLKALGLQIDPKALTDPTAFPLGAIVSLGGCSASFVSADGLVATNHHCSVGALQFNSTPKENLLKDGYLAKTRADEKWAGPMARIFVTQSFRDVTGEVRAGLDAIASPADRYKKIEDRQKQLVAACEKGRPGLRCSVAEHFGGAQYTLIEQLEIKDVRIVYIPPDGIGNFGGDIDNWRWPRHGGDFAFFRAYVGADNKPADHAGTNVPYRPPHHLKLATSPLRENDLVMIAGYPGQTNRLRTAAEVTAAVTFRYPEQVKFCEEFIALFDGLSRKDPALRIKAELTISGLSNYLLKLRGLLDGLDKGGLAKKKASLEEDLQAWINADPGRKAAHGDVIEKMEELLEGREKTREHDAALLETMSMTRLLGAANKIVRMAEERPKPDAERDPDYQERNWQRLEEEQARLQKSYDRELDRAAFKLALQRAARLLEKDRPAILASVLGKSKEVTDAALDEAINKIYAGTRLEDEATRIKQLKTAKLADLKRSQDPMIRLALEVRPALKVIEDRNKAYEGAMSLERPRYTDALRKFQGGMVAPDANRTLRITYGTVRGYRPTQLSPVTRPFTVLSEVVKKSTGKEPFDSPKALLDAVEAKKYGPYVDTTMSEVPVCFLSDLDITGGNSGSPVLDANGRLVGLAFDGNWESVSSNWVFDPAVTRMISVDQRYMRWIMQEVMPAPQLLQELGVAPKK